MKDYPFTLEPYKGMKTKFECPECGRKQKFSRYINTSTGEYLDPSVGRCDRQIKCGYHKTPKQFFQENPDKNRNFPEKPEKTWFPIKNPENISYHNSEILEKSLENYEKNNLVIYLGNILGRETAKKLVEEYQVGTSDHWQGANIFWQIDIQGKIRAGKIMLVNKETGKRIKNPQPLINWVHRVMNIEDFNLKQCFFGENLVNKYPGKPVAIVESEKSAIICSFFAPTMVWLASGNLNGLTLEKCKALLGKRIVLFPDLKCYDIWKSKAMEISGTLNSNNSVITTFSVSDLLEKNALPEERECGYDMADYLTSINRLLPGQPVQKTGFLKPGHNLETFTRDGISWTVEINEHGYPANWDN